MSEIWKNINGFEGFYMVSNYGRIKSIQRTVKSKRWGNQIVREKILKLNQKKNGYVYCVLAKEGIINNCRVHRLVAKAFISNANNLPVVNHKNGIKNYNYSENLEWCTAQQNDLHKVNVLGKQIGANNAASKLVIDLETGILYDNLRIACEAKCCNYKKTSSYLIGKRKGCTSLAYA